MKLTTQQRGYMTERLTALANKRIAKEVKAKLGEEPVVPKLTFMMKCDMIRAGKVKMKPQSQLASYTDLADAYEFPQAELQKAEKALSAFQEKAKEIAKRVNDEKQRIVDVIMLGESADALNAIEDFEKGAA